MPIVGVAGYPGGGKTYAVVRHLFSLRRSARGRCRAVYSNTPLVLPWGPPVVVVDEIEELMDVSDAEIFLDELHIWLPSREWSRHTGLTGWFSQQRKRGNNILYTSQAIDSVDKLVRDRTERLWFCESYFRPDESEPVEDRDGLLTLFRVRRYFGLSRRREDQYATAYFFLNPLIAACYDTGFEVA